MPGSNWGWSYGLSQWIYADPAVIHAGKGWVFLLP